MANYDLTYEGSRVQGILDTGNSLKDAGYIFRGEATPSTVPGTPTERVVYIGGPGTYTNFGSSITVGAGCVCIFKYTGSAWSNQVIDTGLSDAINSEASARQLGDSTLQGGINTVSAAVTAINNAIGNGSVYAGIATPSSTPASGKVFYLALTAGTYTNYGGLEVPQGINILKNNGSTWLLDSFLGIDDAPTQGSANLVKSGGVLGSIIQNGPAFDLSAYNAQGGTLATYADLSAALTALNALPADFKKGGMSMKFVQSSDNKYVQWRLMANSFTTDVTQWQGVDNEPTAGSENLVKSGGIFNITDKLSKETKWISSYGIVTGFKVFPNNAVNYNTGAFSYVAECSCTDYIDISKYSKLVYSNISFVGTYTLFGLAFYDSSKHYLSGISGNTLQSQAGYKINIIDVPQDAKYACFTLWDEDNVTYGVQALKQSFYLLGNHAAQENIDIEQTKEDILNLKNSIKWDSSYGVLSNYDSIIGKGINAADGTLLVAAECSCTDYIDISKYNHVFYARIISTTNAEYTSVGVAFYDSSKQYISGIAGKGKAISAGYNGELLDIPTNAKYARFTYWTEDNETYGVEQTKQSFYIVVNRAAQLNGDFNKVKANNDSFELVSQFNDSKIDYSYQTAQAINFQNGNAFTVPECCATGFIDVSTERAVVLNFICATSFATVVGLAFYDESQNYVNGVRATVKSSIGYERTTFDVPNNAKYMRCTFWNSNYSGMSQFKDKFYLYGYAVAQIYINNLPNNTITIPNTTWIGTTRNYILKLEGENLLHSNDLGNTWKSLTNTIGDIMFVHWFADGTCLICGEDKAYKSRDFNSLIEIPIYDLDGSVFQGGSHNFFHEFSYSNPYNIIDGKETVVWSDYDNSSGYISRIWMSNDNGNSIRCILKNGESIIDGNVLTITHFHHCVWDKFEQCLWVSTGDYDTANKLIKGTCANGVWTFTTIAQGNAFKFGMILFDETYLYLITDITSGDTPRGIVKVAKNSISDENAYSYVYKNPDNISFISYYENNGIKILFPDGAAANRNKVYIAKDNVKFIEHNFVCGDGQSRILGQSIGPNYNGDLVAITYYGYGSGYKLNMSRYLLSEGMLNAGFKDFNKTKLV